MYKVAAMVDKLKSDNVLYERIKWKDSPFWRIIILQIKSHISTIFYIFYKLVISKYFLKCTLYMNKHIYDYIHECTLNDWALNCFKESLHRSKKCKTCLTYVGNYE
jgi:hypothetical protein